MTEEREPQIRSIETTRTARYLVSGSPRNAAACWFVLHGYGHDVRSFLRPFVAFSDSKRFFVAPEGLSRFYTRGMSGSVGASWMTSEAREQEIADYVRYLDAVQHEVLAECRPDVSVNVLGFSQGAATAARWSCYGEVEVDRLVLWGSGLPPDLELPAHRQCLDDLTLAIGEEDRYVTAEALASERDRLEHEGLSYELIRYRGGHEIDQQVLGRILDDGAD